MSELNKVAERLQKRMRAANRLLPSVEDARRALLMIGAARRVPPSIVRETLKRETKKSRLRAIRPDYEYTESVDIDECIACGAKGYPLPGESGYIRSNARRLIERFRGE